MKYTFLLLFLLAIQNLHAQNDTLNKLKLSAYGEVYYSYDFSKPTNHEKANFLYNHKRHNEFNANLLLLKANYQDKYFRANIGFMAGQYAQYNLISEPTWAQFIYEANIGVQLSKKQNLWLDAGILPSHIGFESAISADCWTLTRSILAENSPYYETGIKISYTIKNEKLYLAALCLNGWQRIRKPDDIQLPSFGTQLTFKPNNQLTFNYSTFLGSDKPDTMQAFRHFHNFYLQYEPTGKLGVLAGFDIGMEKAIANKYVTWYAPVLILKYTHSKKLRIAIRGEYYTDPNQVIIATGTLHGFQTFGFSSNIDYSLNDKIRIRFEGRMFQSKDNIFSNSNSNNMLTSNMTIQL